MSRTRLVLASLALMGLSVVGCASQHQEGVKSTYLWQSVVVNANTVDTTKAASAVLESEGLKEITSSSTNADGVASGKKADGTVISVKAKKNTDTVSDVSVMVGKLGDPKLGAEIAAKIKSKAETK